MASSLDNFQFKPAVLPTRRPARPPPAMVARNSNSRREITAKDVWTALLSLVFFAAMASATVSFAGFFSMGSGIQNTMDAWYEWERLQEPAGAEGSNTYTCEWPADLDPETMRLAPPNSFGESCSYDSTPGKRGIRCREGFCKINLYEGDICSFRCESTGLSGSVVLDPECGWTTAEMHSHPCAVMECSSSGGAVRYKPGDVLTTRELKLKCQYPGIWRITGNYVPGKCCGRDDCFGVDGGSHTCPSVRRGCSPVGHFDAKTGLMCYDGVWVPVKFP